MRFGAILSLFAIAHSVALRSKSTSALDIGGLLSSLLGTDSSTTTSTTTTTTQARQMTQEYSNMIMPEDNSHLEEEIQTLTAERSALESELAAVRAEMETLQAEITTLREMYKAADEPVVEDTDFSAEEEAANNLNGGVKTLSLNINIPVKGGEETQDFVTGDVSVIMIAPTIDDEEEQ